MAWSSGLEKKSGHCEAMFHQRIFKSQLDSIMDEFIFDENEPFQERPWIKWESTYEIEAWIDTYNRDMQKIIKDPRASGYGICFMLEEGGEIYLHTTPEGIVLIDVTPDAEWVSPLLAAVTQEEASASRIWTLPVEKLTQLILGLSSLIKSTRMVRNHEFRFKKTGSKILYRDR